MRFASAQWLWLLLAILPLAALVLWEARARRKRFASFASESVWGRIAPSLDWSSRTRKRFVLLAAFALLILALARPQWGKVEQSIQTTGLDIFVILDVSNSMYVEDVVPSRLQKAKHALRSLIEGFQGDRVGIIAFAGSSHLATPLTTDLSYVLEILDVTSPASIQNQGTDIGTALDTAVKALERGAEDLSKSDPGREEPYSKVVILVSDGEDLEQAALEGAKRLRQEGVKFYSLGVGTEKGGPVPVRDSNGNLSGFKRYGGEAVVSRFSPEALQKIAEAAGGRYWDLSPDEREVDQLLEEVSGLSRGVGSERKVVTYRERFQWPLLFGALLILLEMGWAVRGRERQGVALILFWSACSFLVFGSGRVAAAEERTPEAGSYGTYRENQRGIEALRSGDFETARRHFENAQAREPGSPYLTFNQGVLQTQEGKHEDALMSFDSAAQSALEKGDFELAEKAYYNQGAVAESQGNLEGAIQSYLKGIDLAKASGDEKMEKDFRKRIELLQQKPENPQKSKSDQQKEGDGESQNDQQKPQDGEQGGKENQPKKLVRKMPGYQSKKLSKEDAEKVMMELMQKEKELQGRMQKRRGRPMKGGKDW